MFERADKFENGCGAAGGDLAFLVFQYGFITNLQLAANHSVPSNRWYQPTEWYQPLADDSTSP